METRTSSHPAQIVRRQFKAHGVDLAIELGLSHSAAHQWQLIPARHHFDVIRLATANGLNLEIEDLSMTAEQKQKIKKGLSGASSPSNASTQAFKRRAAPLTHMVNEK